MALWLLTRRTAKLKSANLSVDVHALGLHVLEQTAKLKSAKIKKSFLTESTKCKFSGYMVVKHLASSMNVCSRVYVKYHNYVISHKCPLPESTHPHLPVFSLISISAHAPCKCLPRSSQFQLSIHPRFLFRLSMPTYVFSRSLQLCVGNHNGDNKG